ncbi:MAG: 16S rRNA (cytidine(1402)-2'-O)-methyltransferase [Candidatus Cloacimonetes bacterium]|jgi:16S rRNA (cytidine1402-2'-O)-methyltransferase|nr:16S rRNA (cytidine(1402)-2'-O)-methyltransferase [Candidatus Cloacimonadota bacterium]MBT4333775.1 16S rRNA (cytidine(1402)-2'-O)-methyltransferase [Candidatus Cloacimonadota bacterium]
MSSKNKLYVVATHIGNPDDITLRALKVLTNVDFVICEEFKVGSRLLKSYDIKKPLELLNEHNEDEQTQTILDRLVMNNETAAIISDAGTPLFADPGNNLVWQCHQNGIDVVPIPGASSIMAALMVSGLNLDQFLYYGFLPANKDERKRALRRLPNNYDLIILETPYRLKQLLADMKSILGANRQAIIAYKLTQPTEKIFWGSLQELSTMTQELPKGEFVFILRKIEMNKGRKYAR